MARPYDQRIADLIIALSPEEARKKARDLQEAVRIIKDIDTDCDPHCRESHQDCVRLREKMSQRIARIACGPGQTGFKFVHYGYKGLYGIELDSGVFIPC